MLPLGVQVSDPLGLAVNSSRTQGRGHACRVLDRAVLMETWLGADAAPGSTKATPSQPASQTRMRRNLLEGGPQNLIPLEQPRDPTQNCCCRGRLPHRQDS